MGLPSKVARIDQWASLKLEDEMDTRTGEIIDPEKYAAMLEQLTVKKRKHYIEMKEPPTPTQLLRSPPRVGRNESCPCGSGEKFKNCHYSGH